MTPMTALFGYLAVIGMCFTQDDRAPELSLDEIRAEVRATESTLVHLECAYTRRLTASPNRDPNKAIPRDSILAAQWIISERNSFLSFDEEIGYEDEAKRQRHYEQAYDGTTTRFNNNGSVGNIWDRQIPDRRLRPDRLVLPEDIGKSLSLSELLEFDSLELDPLRRVVSNRLLKWHTVKYRDLGREGLGVHPYRSIELATFDDEDMPVLKLVLHLRSDMGYRVERYEFFDMSSEQSQPVIECEVEAWMTLDQGLVLPGRVTHRFFDSDQQGMRIETYRIEYEITEATTDIQPERERFQEIEMPSEVFVIKGLETEQWIDGKRIEDTPRPGDK